MIKKEQIELIKNFLLDKYKFRKNVVTTRVQFKIEKEEQYKDLTDFEVNSLLLELLENDVTCSKQLLINILDSNFSEAFNPFVHYFESLPIYDNQKSYIDELAGLVNTHNNLFFKKCFKVWLTALVGGMIKDNVYNESVLIFVGGQGIGKSTFIRNLVPIELSEYFYSGTINPNNKDTLTFLSDCMLIDLDELENLNKKETSQLKEIVSKKQIMIRRAYNRTSEKNIRRASFIGSTNEPTFLHDLTGTRRYLCFEVFRIDNSNLPPIDLVLAEAYCLFLKGEKHFFDDEDKKEIENNNENFRVVSDLEEMLLKTYAPTEDTNISTYFTASEIYKILTGSKFAPSSQNSKMGKILTKCGFTSMKKRGIKKYLVNDFSCVE